jgi:hypothetical protein
VGARVRQDFLEEVRERSVTEVVEHRRGKRVALHFVIETELGRQHGLLAAESRLQTRHHMRGPEGVGKPRVLGAREDQGRQPKLPDATQSLHLAGVDEGGHHALGVALELHQSVHGIAKDHGAVM